jgi:hypothetical protein
MEMMAVGKAADTGVQKKHGTIIHGCYDIKRLSKADRAEADPSMASFSPADASLNRPLRENQSQKLARSLSCGGSAWDSEQSPRAPFR